MATECGNSNALTDANLKLHPITIAGQDWFDKYKLTKLISLQQQSLTLQGKQIFGGVNNKSL